VHLHLELGGIEYKYPGRKRDMETLHTTKLHCLSDYDILGLGVRG